MGSGWELRFEFPKHMAKAIASPFSIHFLRGLQFEGRFLGVNLLGVGQQDPSLDVSSATATL
jgi:hypothetical protein